MTARHYSSSVSITTKFEFRRGRKFELPSSTDGGLFEIRRPCVFFTSIVSTVDHLRLPPGRVPFTRALLPSLQNFAKLVRFDSMEGAVSVFG